MFMQSCGGVIHLVNFFLFLHLDVLGNPDPCTVTFSMRGPQNSLSLHYFQHHHVQKGASTRNKKQVQQAGDNTLVDKGRISRGPEIQKKRMTQIEESCLRWGDGTEFAGYMVWRHSPDTRQTVCLQAQVWLAKKRGGDFVINIKENKQPVNQKFYIRVTLESLAINKKHGYKY